MFKKNKIILIVGTFVLGIILFIIFSPVRILIVNSKLLFVEMATTPSQRQKGLQNMTSLADDRGMLFVFKEDAFHSFWMKDTYIPLDIAFIDKKKRIVDIQQMIPLDTQIRYVPAKKARYALEVNQGWMKKNNITVNQKVFFW